MAKRKAPPKRKAPKRKLRKIVADEPKNHWHEFMDMSPRYLNHDIVFEIDNSNQNLDHLVNAIHALDQYRVRRPQPDKKPLIELLRSRGTTLAENELVADLIDRHILPKRGRPRRPVYVITDEDQLLNTACSEVEDLRAAGFSRADAITRVSADFDNYAIYRLVQIDKLSLRSAAKRVAERNFITEARLADFKAGRRRSRRKKKK